jgi:hypothetical protein
MASCLFDKYSVISGKTLFTVLYVIFPQHLGLSFHTQSLQFITSSCIHWKGMLVKVIKKGYWNTAIQAKTIGASNICSLCINLNTKSDWNSLSSLETEHTGTTWTACVLFMYFVQRIYDMYSVQKTWFRCGNHLSNKNEKEVIKIHSAPPDLHNGNCHLLQEPCL